MIEKLLLMGGLLLSPRYAIYPNFISYTGRIDDIVFYSNGTDDDDKFDIYNGHIDIERQYIQPGNVLSLTSQYFAEGQDSLNVGFEMYNSYILDSSTNMYLTLQYEFIARTADNRLNDKFRVYYDFASSWNPGAPNVSKLLVGRNFAFDYVEISYCAKYDKTNNTWVAYNYDDIFSTYTYTENGGYTIILSFTADVYNLVYNPAPSQEQPTVVTQEVVDFNGLVFDMIALPFTWLSTFLDFKFFPGTPYEFNLSVVIMSLLTIVALLSIFLFVLKFIKG